MAYLFVDTSELLIVGLLNDKFDWLEYHELRDKKSSALIHALIYELLEKHKVKLKDILGFIQVAGPGSYTGMRVSEGISQVLDWQDIKVNSFYHFEVPSLLEVKKGSWISRAFKGEAFIYSWNAEKENQELILLDDASKRIESEQSDFYTHFAGNFESELNYTSEMIKNNSKELFPLVLSQNLQREPFYYRSLEKEFKVSKK